MCVCVCPRWKETKENETSSEWHPCVCLSCLQQSTRVFIRSQSLMRVNGANRVRHWTCSLSVVAWIEWGACGVRWNGERQKERVAGADMRQPEQATITFNSLTHCIRTDTYACLDLNRVSSYYRQFDINFCVLGTDGSALINLPALWTIIVAEFVAFLRLVVVATTHWSLVCVFYRLGNSSIDTLVPHLMV